MTSKPITRFIKAKDVVTQYKTLEKAAEEASDYVWMRVSANVYVCDHNGKIYPILLSGSDNTLKIACGCEAWRYAHDNDGCKHVAAFLHLSTQPQKPITDEIARVLMAAGWTGGKGNLRPPEATSDEDGEDVEGDATPTDPPKREPVPTPEPGLITCTCQYCGKKFERQNAANVAQIVKEHEATCKDRPKGSDVTIGEMDVPIVPRQPIIAHGARPQEQKTEEETKMAEETKTYTHPDGTSFDSAEQLLDYVEMLKEGQAQDEKKRQAPFTLAPMIKGIQPQMRERGRITIGKKGATNASGRGRKTVKYDHFVFTTTEKDEKTDDYILDDAMNTRYGKDCREIPVRFLSDDITEIFYTAYMKYTASGLKLKGDGENWVQYNADGTRTHITDPNGDHGFLDDPDVKPHGILTVLVDGQESVGSVYRWRTTGWNSIRGMLASLALCAKIAERAGGRIAFLPMKLVYSTKWQTPKGHATKKKIPVITCEFRGTVEQLQERSREAMQYLSAPNAVDVTQLAAANVYDVDAETLEEQKDVADEFASGAV